MLKKVFIGYYDAANLTTIVGMLFALVACFFAFEGDIRLAMVCLIIAGVADLFDGQVARKLKRTEDAKSFGVQLDSLVDVVSFGIAPVVIAFCSGETTVYAIVAYALYLIAAVVRLAYFNAVTALGDRRFFQGLPVTYAALIVPIVFLLDMPPVHVAAFVALAVLFIVNVKIPKPRGVFYILFPLLAVVLIVAWCLL